MSLEYINLEQIKNYNDPLELENIFLDDIKIPKNYTVLKVIIEGIDELFLMKFRNIWSNGLPKSCKVLLNTLDGNVIDTNYQKFKNKIPFKELISKKRQFEINNLLLHYVPPKEILKDAKIIKSLYFYLAELNKGIGVASPCNFALNTDEYRCFEMLCTKNKQNTFLVLYNNFLLDENQVIQIILSFLSDFWEYD